MDIVALMIVILIVVILAGIVFSLLEDARRQQELNKIIAEWEERE